MGLERVCTRASGVDWSSLQWLVIMAHDFSDLIGPQERVKWAWLGGSLKSQGWTSHCAHYKEVGHLGQFLWPYKEEQSLRKRIAHSSVFSLRRTLVLSHVHFLAKWPAALFLLYAMIWLLQRLWSPKLMLWWELWALQIWDHGDLDKGRPCLLPYPVSLLCLGPYSIPLASKVKLFFKITKSWFFFLWQLWNRNETHSIVACISLRFYWGRELCHYENLSSKGHITVWSQYCMKFIVVGSEKAA